MPDKPLAKPVQDKPLEPLAKPPESAKVGEDKPKAVVTKAVQEPVDASVTNPNDVVVEPLVMPLEPMLEAPPDGPSHTVTGPVKSELGLPVAEDKYVLFQYDRDTTIVAKVLREYKDGRLDLQATTSQQSYVPPSGSAPPSMSTKVYNRVRPGSRYEPGTWFVATKDDE